MRWTTREAVFKEALVAGLAPREGERILDLGCGTGTLALAIATLAPRARVVGIDADDGVLARARAKQARSGATVQWHRGFAHAEVTRVVRPAGRVLIADWGRPANPAFRALFLAVQFLDGFATTRDSVEGVLPGLMTEAGLRAVGVLRQFGTPLGTIAIYSATRG